MVQIFAQVVSIAFALVGIVLFVRVIRQILGVVRMGQPTRRSDRLGSRTATMVKETVGHTRMLQWTWVGIGHWFVFVGFGLLFFTLVTAFGQLFDPHFALPVIGHFFVWEWVTEIFTFVMVAAIIAFIYYRATRPTERTRGVKGRFWGSTMWQGYFVELIILGVGLCIAVLRGLEYALLTKGGEHAGNATALHFPLSWPLGKAFEGLSTGTLENLIFLVAMAKIIISFTWMITISVQPTMGVAWHRFLVFFNVFFKRHADGSTSLGALAPMTQNGVPIDFEDLEEMDEDTVLGVGKVEDFAWKGILDFSTCTECGRCQSQCPAWNTEKPLSPKLLITALRDHAYAKAPYVQAPEAERPGLLEGDAKLALEVARPLAGETGDDDWFYMPDSGVAVIDSEVLWNCTSCGACVQQCPVDIEHVDHIIDMRRYAVLVESNFPSELNGLFKGLENKGNPWNMSPTARMDWAKDLPFDVKVVGEDVESLDEVEWLFWVGCAGAYEDRAKKTTRAVAELLDMAGVSFAVLGNGETCTGDPARRAGNEFVFQGLATQNAQVFQETKAKKVVSTCAHCFNTLKNEYAAFGVELEVVHHTQLLNRLVREKKLVPVATNGGGSKRSVTYHDPCYIGRHNGVYAPPRELLNVIPDATLTEMPRNSERSFCCGAGGARMWMEENTGERINLNRTKEAVATGADQIAVGCPFCRVMLSDGLTAQQAAGEAREEVEVLDIAQMLLASVKGETKPAAKPVAEPAAKAAEPKADPEATKAEPEPRDTTQSPETITTTADAGPLAKASGGSSLFDTDAPPADETPARTTVNQTTETAGTEPAVGEEKPASSSLFDLGGPEAEEKAPSTSLFDLGGAETTDTAEPAPAQQPAQSSAQSSAQTTEPEPKSSGGLGGGSLFDIADFSEPGATTEPEGSAAETESTADPTSPPATTVPQSGSLFDIKTPDEEPAPTPAATSENAAAATSIPEGRSLFDIADPVKEPAEQKPASPEQSSGPASSGATAAAAAPATKIPEGGSLFDIETPAEEPAPPASDESTPADHDAAADSTTHGRTDRSQDAADTDVAPDQDDGHPDVQAQPTSGPAPSASGATAATATPATKIPEGGSLFDIETPAEGPVPPASDESTPADHDAAADSTTQGHTDRSQDAADTDVAPDQEEGQPDRRPKPAHSGDNHQPRTDAEIGEGKSLFDL